MFRRIGLLIVLGLMTSISLAADWPGWLGPQRNGSSPETGLFRDRSFELKVAWRNPLGVAYSGIAVVDDRAVTVYGDGEFDWLVAFDAKTGDESWRRKLGAMHPKIGNADGGQSGMPVVDDGVIYLLTSQGTLRAMKFADGSDLWTIDLVERFEARKPRFGFATTPMPAGRLLFVQTGGSKGRALTAFDKRSGEVLWSVGDDEVGYQSPTLAKLAGERTIVAVMNKSFVGLSPKGGRVLWSHPYALGERDGAASPVLLGDDRFFLAGDNECATYEVTKGKDGFRIEEIWRNNSMKRSLATAVFHDGYLYGFNGSFLTSVAADSGKVAWKSRDADGKALILVDGQLVILGNDGTLVIAEANPKGFVETARLPVADEGSHTYPSFSDGTIFLRNLAEIVGVRVQSKE